MAYLALKLDSKTPPRVKALILSLENHYLSDVHTMLRLPQPDLGLVAGCNFAIAQVLAAVVSGVSVTLYGHGGGSGAQFRGVLKNFYPWSREPKKTVEPEEGAGIIYSLFRNPLTHDLGLDLEEKRKRYKTQKIIIKRLATEKGLSERIVEQLESDPSRITVTPTITTNAGRSVLLVERFYWGVRTMIEELSHDEARMQKAKEFLLRRAKRG